MPLLNVSGVEKYFGDLRVLEGITLQLQPAEKAGLIGPNGSGKSTLLKVITGELAPDRGTVQLARGSKTGYLPQSPPQEQRGSLRSHLEKPLIDLIRHRDELASLESEITLLAREENEKGRLDRLIERYGDIAARFEENGGYRVESRIAAVSRGLGFTPEDLDRDMTRFSGGEKTRARLAALLLQEPDLLLLDEPTNFLDLEGLEWLEGYLRDWPRALIVVSHDRLFLDRVAGRIFSMQGTTLKSYPGNYSAYLSIVEQERLTMERTYKKQQQIREREEKLIRESKADERSKRQARSRRKRLDRLDAVEKQQGQESFKLQFDYAGRSGYRVLSFDGVTKAYGSKSLFQEVSFEIYRGDRVALVGPNGAGKTTLLRLIAGEERPDFGHIQMGPTVRVSYFDQEQGMLDSGQTVLESITGVSNQDIKQCRNHLGRYLFRGDDVFKKVGELSGGEKNRLALARLALDSGNCLLMDEPTGHLDLASMEELEETLAAYPGTLIIVSHDRYFLAGMVNRVFTLSRGRLSVHEGDFQSYLATKAGAASGEMASNSGKKEDDRHLRRREHRRRLERQRHEQKLAAACDAIEEKIALAENRIKQLEMKLSDPGHYDDLDELRRLGAELELENKQVTRLLDEWEETSRQLEIYQGDVPFDIL